MANLTNGKSHPITEDISINSGLGDDGIDLNGRASLQQNLNEEQDLEKQRLMQEYREELNKIQEDISTLKLVLNDKLKRENELKTLLGVSFVDEIKQDFTEGFNSIKSTTAYQKTSSGLKTASQKITPAFQSLGGTMKNSLSNLGNLRNTSMFKSFEAGISSTLSTTRMKNSKSEFAVDGNEPGSMTTSKSTLGTTSVSGSTNGASKHDTILEDKEKN